MTGIWALFTPVVEHLGVSELRALVREFHNYGRAAETVIMEKNDRAIRFAVLFGFQPTEGTTEIAGQTFRLWRTKWPS